MVRKELAFIGFALLFVSCMNGGTNSNVKQYKLDNYQVLNEYDFDTIGTIRDAIIYQKNIIIDSLHKCQLAQNHSKIHYNSQVKLHVHHVKGIRRP